MFHPFSSESVTSYSDDSNYRQVHEHRPRSVGDVGHVVVLAGGPARQVPDEPGVDVSEEKLVLVHGLANSRNILQKPLELEGTDRTNKFKVSLS